MTEPTNSCGFHIEHFTDALGFKPCTHPVATRKEVEKQFKQFDPMNHRIYTALIGYTLT